MKTRKFKYLVIALVVTMAMCTTGCRLSKEQLKEAKKYQKQAEKNAVEYIEEKYGFKAEVVDSEYNRTGMFAEVVSTYVDVQMKYEGKKFDVYIAGNNSWEDMKDSTKEQSMDNYQYSEIKEEMEAYLEEELDDLNIEEVILKYTNNSECNLEHMLSEKYDGSIENWLDASNIYVDVITYDEKAINLEGVDFGKANLKVFSYDKSIYKEHGHVIEADYYVGSKSLWLNWYAMKNSKETKVTTYAKMSFEYGYMVFDEDCYVDMKELDIDSDAMWEASKDPIPMLKGFEIKSNASDIYVFVEDNYDIKFGMEYEKAGKKKTRVADGGNSFEGYSVITIDMENCDDGVRVYSLED